jgi:hypothetical protein
LSTRSLLITYFTFHTKTTNKTTSKTFITKSTKIPFRLNLQNAQYNIISPLKLNICLEREKKRLIKSGKRAQICQHSKAKVNRELQNALKKLSPEDDRKEQIENKLLLQICEEGTNFRRDETN